MTDLIVLATTSRPDIGTQWLPGSIRRTMPDDAPQPRPDFYTPLPRSFPKFTRFIDEHIRIIQVGKTLTSASSVSQCERQFCSRQPKALRLPWLSAGARCPEPTEQLTAHALGSYYNVSHLNISCIISKY